MNIFRRKQELQDDDPTKSSHIVFPKGYQAHWTYCGKPIAPYSLFQITSSPEWDSIPRCFDCARRGVMPQDLKLSIVPLQCGTKLEVYLDFFNAEANIERVLLAAKGRHQEYIDMGEGNVG